MTNYSIFCFKLFRIAERNSQEAIKLKNEVSLRVTALFTGQNVLMHHVI